MENDCSPTSPWTFRYSKSFIIFKDDYIYISIYGQIEAVYDRIFLIEDLTALSKFTSNSIVLQPFDNEILQYLCEHPSTSAYELYTKETLGKGIDYRKIRRHINELSVKGLIDVVQTKPSEHKAKYGKLS